VTWLVVGLGNPGTQYAATRHNIGFWVVDVLARRSGERLARHKRAVASTAQVRIGGSGPAGTPAVLVEPLSFMNDSGGPVKALMSFYDVSVEHLVVVHDELDLPLGRLRIKRGGGDNGHNGLRSIRSALGTGDFIRIRLGIGRPPGRQDPADFVLKAFSSDERTQASVMAEEGADAVEELLARGLSAAQNAFNPADPQQATPSPGSESP
jgi:PTH1 family peptidyl-tRNA hydrolase